MPEYRWPKKREGEKLSLLGMKCINSVIVHKWWFIVLTQVMQLMCGELELNFYSTCLQSPAFPHHTVSCMRFSGPAAHSTPLWARQLVDASGTPSTLWHVILLRTTHQHWFSCSHPPYLSFPQQIRENDQWDVPGGNRAADPDWLDQTGSPLPRPDFRTSPDQGHLWNQVLVSDWKVTHDQFHLLDFKAPILGHDAVSPGSSRFEI